MGLTSWKKSPNGKIMESDVIIAKNYLSEDEFDFTSFSLEYNFAGSESVLVFGYKSENNYIYIKLL